MQAYAQRYNYGQECPPYSSSQAYNHNKHSTTSSSQYGSGGYGSYGYGGGYGGSYGGPPQSQMMNTYQNQTSQQMHQSSASTLNVFGSDPFCEIMPSAFPPGTDRKVIECFNRIDRDGNGAVDDRELQAVLSSCSQSFSLRTVHLLMYEFTHSNRRVIGPKEFVPLLNCLQKWRTIFQRFDRDRNGSIDSMELGTALNSLGFCVSPTIVNLLIAKFNKSAGGRCSLQYDQFIECCLTVKGLTETFKAKEDKCGKATFSYEEFLLNVLPFIIA